jgi:hypothetical protein
MSPQKKTISAYVQRFVARKFEQFKKEADKGCGLHYELYVQKFTDSVDAFVGRTKRSDLREYISSEARKDDDYLPAEEGRWFHDEESNECHFFEPDDPGKWMFKDELHVTQSDNGAKAQQIVDHGAIPKEHIFDRIVERMGSGASADKPKEHAPPSRSIDRY